MMVFQTTTSEFPARSMGVSRPKAPSFASVELTRVSLLREPNSSTPPVLLSATRLPAKRVVPSTATAPRLVTPDVLPVNRLSATNAALPGLTCRMTPAPASAA